MEVGTRQKRETAEGGIKIIQVEDDSGGQGQKEEKLGIHVKGKGHPVANESCEV